MRRLALLIVAGTLVLMPPSAQAKKSTKEKGLGPVVTATATGPAVSTPAGTSAATASCPSGLQAVGGGFSAPFTAGGAMVVTDSYRSSPGAWSVTGTLVSGSGSATAYVYCRRKGLRLTDVAVAASLPSGSGQIAQVEADCAPKAVAVGGGFQMTAGPVAAHLPIPEQSIGGGPVRGGVPPVGNWRVVAQNSNTGGQTVTAHVYCATGIRVPAFRQDLGSATVPVFGSVTRSSSCFVPAIPKRGRRPRRPPRLLSAGGFYSPFFPGTAVLPVHTDSRIVGDRFIDTAVNGGGGTGELTAQSQAICF